MRSGRRFSIHVDAALEVGASDTEVATAREVATLLLGLPWELLHDGDSFLFQGAKPTRVRRRLPNTRDLDVLEDWFAPVLFQEKDDPQLFRSTPAKQTREEFQTVLTNRMGELPPSPSTGFVGRSRRLRLAPRSPLPPPEILDLRSRPPGYPAEIGQLTKCKAAT